MANRSKTVLPINCSRIEYQDYEKLIASRAWAWHRRTRWDFDELMAEGNLVFVLSQDKFDSKKSCFSTYLYGKLEIRFGNLIFGHLNPDPHPKQSILYRKHRGLEPNDVSLSLLQSQDASPEQSAALEEMINRLSHDAQVLTECVLETPKELISMLRGRSRKRVKISRYALQRYFIGKKGWSESRCWKAFSEIKIALATL